MRAIKNQTISNMDSVYFCLCLIIFYSNVEEHLNKKPTETPLWLNWSTNHVFIMYSKNNSDQMSSSKMKCIIYQTAIDNRESGELPRACRVEIVLCDERAHWTVGRRWALRVLTCQEMPEQICLDKLTTYSKSKCLNLRHCHWMVHSAFWDTGPTLHKLALKVPFT